MPAGMMRTGAVPAFAMLPVVPVPGLPVEVGIVFGTPASPAEGRVAGRPHGGCLPAHRSVRPPDHERPVHGRGQNECMIALGPKNCLFIGSANGGKTAAIAYVPIKTARFNDLDPQVCGFLRI